MSGKLELPFDPEAFLSDAAKGTTKSAYEENKVIFSQGEAADSIFYINDGKVKLTVLSEQGKEAVVAILGHAAARAARRALRPGTARALWAAAAR
jgi:CRP/FNR family cyclic AMP-dependent transcriptional regulator